YRISWHRGAETMRVEVLEATTDALALEVAESADVVQVVGLNAQQEAIVRGSILLNENEGTPVDRVMEKLGPN
ncbi:MAG: hypothetical protein F6K30_19960, partial [Cyanothece sp. SIO2G6]|nr:hypothetical protein [Cyanothece sp. SIO2G6]